MGMTVTENILARAAGREALEPGEIVNAAVDLVMVQDNNAPMVIREFNKINVERIWDPSKVAFVIDHHSPSSTVKAAEHQAVIRKFVKEQGVGHFFDGGNGICHILMLEQGLSGTGKVVVGSDSHTTGQGALGSFATGIGSTEVAATLATGFVWLRVPESIKVEVSGKMPTGTDARDVVGLVLRDLGPGGANYVALEYAGEVIEGYTLSEKATICMMGVEMGAKNSIIVPSPDEAQGQLVESDPDAKYLKTLSYDVADLEPLVACPSLPTNIKPVGEVGKVSINQALVGACSGGSLRDFKAAAAILKGRQVKPGVRMILVPNSREVMKEAVRVGLVETILEAGAIVSSPACSVCAGYEVGVLAPGEVCISSTTRNMPGRMGPGGEIYLGSAATVAASAVNGYISDPREFL